MSNPFNPQVCSTCRKVFGEGWCSSYVSLCHLVPLPSFPHPLAPIAAVSIRSSCCPTHRALHPSTSSRAPSAPAMPRVYPLLPYPPSHPPLPILPRAPAPLLLPHSCASWLSEGLTSSLPALSSLLRHAPLPPPAPPRVLSPPLPSLISVISDDILLLVGEYTLTFTQNWRHRRCLAVSAADICLHHAPRPR